MKYNLLFLVFLLSNLTLNAQFNKEMKKSVTVKREIDKYTYPTKIMKFKTAKKLSDIEKWAKKNEMMFWSDVEYGQRFGVPVEGYFRVEYLSKESFERMKSSYEAKEEAERRAVGTDTYRLQKLANYFSIGAVAYTEYKVLSSIIKAGYCYLDVPYSKGYKITFKLKRKGNSNQYQVLEQYPTFNGNFISWNQLKMEIDKVINFGSYNPELYPVLAELEKKYDNDKVIFIEDQSLINCY